MLIDKIILSKTEYIPEQFTGGAIQMSVSKYTKIMNIKLVLYFGFNATRNSISKQIKIQEKDVEILTKELLLKTKAYQQNLYLDNDILSIDEIVNDSYECNKNIVRHATNDIDKVDKVDKVDSDKINASSDAKINEDFNICWEMHSLRLKEIKTKEGNIRRNSKKSECKKAFIQLSSKYSSEAICCIVRNDTLRTTPKEFLNLIRKSLDIELLKILNFQDIEVLNEALQSDDSEFLEFIEAIEGQI